MLETVRLQRSAVFFLSVFLGLVLSACKDSGDPFAREAARPIRVSSKSGSLCHGLRIDNRFDSIPAMDKPGYLNPYRDPTFNTRVVRISNTLFGQVVKPMYSTIQSWNADESLLILYHTGVERNGHYLYDGKNYSPIGKLDILTGNIEEVFWHHTDPDILYYISALFSHYGSLMEYNVRTQTAVELANFDSVCGDGQGTTAGNNIMMPSWNDDYFGFRCADASLGVAFSYRLSTDEVSTLPIGGNSPYQPWFAPMPAPSGQNYLLNESILSPDLQRTHRQLDLFEFHSHSSLGRLKNGNDALFATGFDPSPEGCDNAADRGVGALIVHDLNTGLCRAMISESDGYGEPISGTHISAVAHKNPGWIALSSIGYERFFYLTNQRAAPVLLSEIFLANTDPQSHEICRLAHHRTHGKDSRNGGYISYLGEPHVTISPTGTRILFGSDWHDGGSVDTYVIELPAYDDTR